MAKLDRTEPYDWVSAFKHAEDETVKAPLWDFPPESFRAQLHERRRRFGVHEETGDPEYG